jgi:P27 family predicted phage terminase small subunit
MRKKYKEFDERVQAQLSMIENFLIEKFGKVNKTWQVGLQMLADNLDKFYECKDHIDEDGVYVKCKNGAFTKHPLLGVQKDLEVQITKLLVEFGLTPRSSKRLLSDDDGNDDEDAIKELLLG